MNRVRTAVLALVTVVAVCGIATTTATGCQKKCNNSTSSTAAGDRC